MTETVLATSVFVLLAAAVLVDALLPGWMLLRVCGLVVVLGLLVSLAGGALYHLALWRTLGRRAALPPRWWLWPTALHDRLTDAERAKVLPWFGLGAGGFVAVLLGCAGVLFAAFARNDGL